MVRLIFVCFFSRRHPECPPDKPPKPLKCKTRSQFSREFGYNYPLHRACSRFEQGAGDGLSVPKNMAWRWDMPVKGIGRPWQPGHINKTVWCLMKYSLNPFPYDTLPLTRRDVHGRIIKKCEDDNSKQMLKQNYIQKPTIRVQKKDGEYSIIMNPLKEKKQLETDCYPYLNCSPLKFVIKKHPEEIKKHRAKKILRERGLVKQCSCENLKRCCCKSQREKKFLEFEMKNISRALKLENELKYDDLNESSDSEMEMQLTTPSAVIKSQKCKPDVIHCGTQYSLKDFASPKVDKNKDDDKKTKKPLKPKEAGSSLSDAEKRKLKMLALAKKKVESVMIDAPCPRVTFNPTSCC